MGKTNSHKSQLIWRHNSFLGHVQMAKRNMESIGYSLTATPEAKEIARKIYRDLTDLGLALKDRAETDK